jgi:hypothetical protein
MNKEHEAKVPKYIKSKIERLDNLLLSANILRNEIESWAKNKGADTAGLEWYENVVDECSGCSGISLDGLEEYFESDF